MLNEIVKLIKIISNKIDTKMQILLSGLDLTPQQVQILIYLLSNDCKNQQQICKFFRLSSPTVNGILNRLEEKGFIEREKSIDKRNNIIKTLPKAGLVNNLFLAAVDYNNAVLTKSISNEELVDFKKILLKMLKNIEEGNYDKNFSEKY